MAVDLELERDEMSDVMLLQGMSGCVERRENNFFFLNINFK